jgi:hypothetical protein
MKLMRKNLLELSSGQLREITSFLDSSFCTIFHEPDFNRVVSEIFDTKFSYGMVYDRDGRLTALCPYHSKRQGLSTMTFSNPAMYGLPYGGWVSKSKEVSVAELFERTRLSTTEALTYWSMPQIVGNDYEKVRNARNFQTAIIDLGKDVDFIWNNVINSKRRNMIRKARNNNVLIASVGHSGLKTYFQLTKATHWGVGYDSRMEEYYSRVLDIYIPKKQAIILLAKSNAITVSGIVLLKNRHICHYWIGASEKPVSNLGQGELLQWEAIRWAKNSGSRYYDLCVIESERLPNIALFKLGFSRHIVPFYCITKRTIAFRILSRMQKIAG